MQETVTKHLSKMKYWQVGLLDHVLNLTSEHGTAQKAFCIIITARADYTTSFENLFTEKQLYLFLKQYLLMSLWIWPSIPQVYFQLFLLFLFHRIIIIIFCFYRNRTNCVVPVFSAETKRSCYLPCHVSVPLLEELDIVCYRPNIFLN